MYTSAHISNCQRYRYSLERVWDNSKQMLTWVMLNPSTADWEQDDPTIRRCMGFARSSDYGGIIVVNLFALRATNPDDMKAALDPVGPENMAKLAETLGASHRVVAAWGTHGGYRDQDQKFIDIARSMNIKVYCLGVTKEGFPRHPLYVKADQPFEELLYL